jgi:outer membrane lipoprotein-sorting protein
MHSYRAAAFLASAAALLGIVNPTFAAGNPTGQQILQRCQKAYDSARTLDETVTASMGGRPGGTAHILFQRPGKLRVSGTTMFGSSKYDLVSNGATWVSTGGSWEQEKSAEMGIAAITGISGTAGTNVPALLLHTSWGTLATGASALTVASDTVNGHATYRVSMTTPFTRSIWIDKKTFFLVKISQSLGGYNSVVTFGTPRINGPIPAKAFVR